MGRLRAETQAEAWQDVWWGEGGSLAPGVYGSSLILGEIRTSENSYFCQAARQLASVPSSQLCVKLASGGDPTYAFNIRFTGEEVHGTSKWQPPNPGSHLPASVKAVLRMQKLQWLFLAWMAQALPHQYESPLPSRRSQDCPRATLPFIPSESGPQGK